jgi:hypothetical protein
MEPDIRQYVTYLFLLFLILRSATAPACANSFFIVLPKKKVSLSELALEGSQLRGGPVCHPSGLLERTNGVLPSMSTSALDLHVENSGLVRCHLRVREQWPCRLLGDLAEVATTLLIEIFNSFISI